MSETFLAACALRSADATTPAAMGLRPDLGAQLPAGHPELKP